MLLVDAFAIILNRKNDIGALCFGLQIDPAMLIGKLYGIGQQIADNKIKMMGIGKDVNVNLLCMIRNCDLFEIGKGFQQINILLNNNLGIKRFGTNMDTL